MLCTYPHFYCYYFYYHSYYYYYNYYYYYYLINYYYYYYYYYYYEYYHLHRILSSSLNSPYVCLCVPLGCDGKSQLFIWQRKFIPRWSR